MKTTLIIFGLSLSLVVNSLGCHCSIRGEFKNQDDLKEYDFISYVKITSIETAPENKQSHSAHRIRFKTLEHFKGSEKNEILVLGGNQSLNIGWSSCDLGENINEEWVIFAQIDKNTKELIIQFCSRTSRYKRVDGYRYHGYADYRSTLDKLREVFQKSTSHQSFRKTHLEYYKNGNPEIEEHYKNRKLEGVRYSWFPNNALESKQNYELGLRQGISERYSESGQLLLREKFNKGVRVDTTTRWHTIETNEAWLRLHAKFFGITQDSAKRLYSMIQISNQHIYDQQENLLHSTAFTRSGAKQSESSYFREENRAVHRFFYENGSLKSESHEINGKNYGVYTGWDEHGTIVKSWRYDENGKQIKESIKIGIEANR